MTTATKQPRPHYKAGEQPEFVPDAWARFERAVKVVAKAEPKHRVVKQPSKRPKKV